MSVKIHTKKIFFLALFVALFCLGCISANATKEPNLDCNRINFENRTSILLRSDEECLPISDVRVFIDAERVIYVSRKPLVEDVLVGVTIYDFQGNLINRSKSFFGRVIFLESKKRIILANISHHYKTTSSMILSFDGEKVREIKQNQNVFEISKSKDDSIVWFMSEHLEKESPCIDLHVYSSDGEFLHNAIFDSEEKYIFRFNNKPFVILIPEPKIPG